MARQRELEMLEEAGIRVDTTVPDPVQPMAPAGAAAEDSDDPEDDTAPTARVLPIKRGQPA